MTPDVPLVQDPLPYRERLWVPWWWWPTALAWPAMLGIAYGYAIGSLVGWGVFAVSAGLVAFGLIHLATLLEVRPHEVRAGRVRLPASVLGAATPLDAVEARRLRGVEADPRAFTVMRGWLSRGVRLALADPLDPTPYWYLSSRQPEQLAAALQTARLRARQDGPPAPR